MPALLIKIGEKKGRNLLTGKRYEKSLGKFGNY